MESRFLTGVMLVGLVAVAFGLIAWLTRHDRARGSMLDPKAACAMVALSFVFVGAAMVAETLPPSTRAVGASGKSLPPNIFTVTSTALFFCAALLAAIGLWLGAAFQLVSSWRSRSGAAQRRSAARLAVYGIGAILVAMAHLALLRTGPGLLK